MPFKKNAGGNHLNWFYDSALEMRREEWKTPVETLNFRGLNEIMFVKAQAYMGVMSTWIVIFLSIIREWRQS